jgi:hypothetical protein
MADPYQNVNMGATGPLSRIEALTLHDSTNFPNVLRAVCVTTAGAYVLVTPGGDAVSTYLAAGVFHPVRVVRINATGAASAAGVVGGY